ncbi:hypothetical protein [Pseudoalteromonas sp. T1lg22]|uniref:hypothetical protein n=1 Tax=Pseudoalteromonas sp. T1lg22 TaxID=2077096 RepID=UPI000CF671C0|nr:hypothetical protein [Pseudoalteromonas sp. T1lg22]
MKRFNCKQLVRALGVALISTASLYGISTTPAHASEHPIWPVPANNGDYCMADAYFNAGGAGLKNINGETLNCTANDVEITNVVPIGIRLDEDTVIYKDQLEDGETLTCTAGSEVQLIANVTVRANAAERWDTTFYVPLQARDENDNIINPDVVYSEISNDGNDYCTKLVPVPYAADEEGNFMVNYAHQLDGDNCGDINKSELIADEYTLMEAEFTIACEGGDDNQLDFNYCAAWDNQERNNCTVDDDLASPETPTITGGQVPNTKSKCKCDNFNIDVFIEPDPPTVTKTRTPTEADEPGGTFVYTVKIEKAKDENMMPTGADVAITNIEDIYKSTTASPNSGPYTFDLDGTTSDHTQGNVTLLGGENSYNADDACWKLELPVTLTNTSPTLSCTFKVKIDDEDLRDNDPWNEEYEDFIRFSATDSEGRGTDVGDDTCNPFDAPLEAGDNCSAVVKVTIENVDPTVTITKTPVAGPGLRRVPAGTGPYFVDDAGNITYELKITNTSLIDDLDITSLWDDNGTPEGVDPELDTDKINLLSDSTAPDGYNHCSAADDAAIPASEVIDGETVYYSFTCRYVVTLVDLEEPDPDWDFDEGDTYTNKVYVTGMDNETREASNNDSASVTHAAPMITLEKDVAVSGDVNTPTPALDSTEFKQTANVNEPGGTVVYRFTVTNANDITEEDLTLTALVDDVLFNSPRATESASQRVDYCDFTTVVEYGTPYVCTIVADVTGQTPADPSLLNTAYVTAVADNGQSVKSNEPTAEVIFDDVEPKFETTFGLSAMAYISIKNTSPFESIELNALSVHGVDMPAVDTTADDGDVLRFINDGMSVTAYETNFPYCVLDTTIAVGATYNCHVRLEFNDSIGFFAFEALLNSAKGGIEVVVIDDDGTTRSANADVKVELASPPALP